LIVDDHHELRRAIRNLLECQRGFVVCGEAKDGVEAIQKSDELRPDVVVLNIIMPVMNVLHGYAIAQGSSHGGRHLLRAQIRRRAGAD